MHHFDLKVYFLEGIIAPRKEVKDRTNLDGRVRYTDSRFVLRVQREAVWERRLKHDGIGAELGSLRCPKIPAVPSGTPA
jgi:hypothetical protein